MNFEQFNQYVTGNIKDYLPEQYKTATVTLQKVTKNNDTVLTGLLIKIEDSNITPNIYLETFYAQYRYGREIEDIMRDIADTRVQHEIGRLDVSQIINFDQVKDHIICKLVNAGMNADYLADKPHTIIEDLAVVYAVDLGGGESGRMSAPITNGLMEQYGVSTEELHDIALQNLSESQIVFKTMRDALVETMFPEGLQEDDPRALMLPPEEENPLMYVLTNKEKINGAIAILDSKKMKNISQKLGGDFVVIPSSVHEVIILPVEGITDHQEELNALINNANAEIVAPEEWLSDHFYIYDSKEMALKIAA